MKISILISSYNKGKYIEKCIESCLQQNTNNFEIILIDNYSEDHTNFLLNKFKKKIKIIKKKRISKYSSVNQIDVLLKGLNNSSGNIICLLDGDDYFKPNKVLDVRNFFKKSKKINVLFDLPIIIQSKYSNQFKLKKKIQKKIWPTIIPTSSISIRRDYFINCINENLFKDYNLLEIDFRINTYSRFFSKDYKVLKKSLNIYRQVDDGIMSNIKKFSILWWNKRLQAHQFMKNIFFKNNKKYQSLDFLITRLIVNFFNLFKL